MPRGAFNEAEEAEVLALYASGLGAHEVAKRMGRSIQAVNNCLKRYGVKKRDQAHQIYLDTLRANGSLSDRLKGLVRENKESGCWEFIGPPDPDTGYGNTSLFGRRCSVHRLAWLAYCGPIPKGMVICHRCDNRLCGNPEHLFIGTPQDNINDAKAKGRLMCGIKRSLLHRGEKAPHARLTWEKVRAIRAALAAGASRHMLATEYGVHPSNIWAIGRGKTWKEGWSA